MNSKRFKEKIVFYKKLKKFKLSVFDSTPFTDWYLIVSVSAILLIGFLYLGYATYQDIYDSIDVDVSGDTSSGEELDYDEMQKLIEGYENKAENLNQLR